MTTLAVVHGVRVTSLSDLVPTDARKVNPKRVPYRDYVREQERSLLARAHWQTCTCPICEQSVIIPDWSLHVLMHTRDIHIIGIVLSAVMAMFNDSEGQQEPAKAA